MRQDIYEHEVAMHIVAQTHSRPCLDTAVLEDPNEGGLARDLDRESI